MKLNNIYALIPDTLEEELFDVLVETSDIKIERIVSKGHSSPKSGWYEQNHGEWVMLLKGEAILGFEQGDDLNLKVGCHLNIPAHTKHKVVWTTPESDTIWLIVQY